MDAKKRTFKYYPKDFGKLEVRVSHMDIVFDIYSKKTNVESKIHLEALKDIKNLTLNADSIELHDLICDSSKVSYNYDIDKKIIYITFLETITKGTSFKIMTKSTCFPSKTILEGMYYDETPKGCQCQMITQCQQWGFQRIVPCIDDMTAKCTYTTTIKANKGYTNYITNGDIVKKLQPISKTRIEITYENSTTPMATYLFFLGVGTYKTFKREFEYPNGDTFSLELLVPPKSNKETAQKALTVLHDAIMWVYLFTGPKKYDNEKISFKILNLIKEREMLKISKSNENKLTKIRKKIFELTQGLTLGYTYTGTIYREIAMQNSDFGGMENVGNTTISTNRIMPFKEMTDGVFDYMIRVKVHEYYHNLNGSEVTGMSPFEIWLNEAVTVHIEREYHSFLFGEEYSRLADVIPILSYGNGILSNDSGVQALPILPEGFNSPNELITNITYIKAPEFVRMIQKTLGDKKFVLGLNDYHTKFKHSNATTHDWLSSMQKYTNKNLILMGKQWLNKVKYPELEITVNYDKKLKLVILTFNQINATKTNFWSFPINYAIFSNKKKIKDLTLFMDSKETKIELKNISKYDFISFNRELSFYGKVVYTQTEEELNNQILYDDDNIGKFTALQKRFDIEKKKLFLNIEQPVDRNLLEIYFNLLNNKTLFEQVGGQFFTIFENIDDVKYGFNFKKVYDVKNKILGEFATIYKKKLLKLYDFYSKSEIDTEFSFPKNEIKNIKFRQMKNILLSILAKLDTQDIHVLIKKQFHISTNATDKVTAFRLYIESNAEDRFEILKKYESESKKNLVAWEVFLSIIGSNDNDNSIELIKKIENSKSFRIEQANDQRSLFVSFAFNKKNSLQTEKGRKYLEEIMIKLTKINQNSTNRIFSIFGNLDEMEKEDQLNLVTLLKEVNSKIDSKKYPAVHNTIERILIKSPKSMKNWEKNNI